MHTHFPTHGLLVKLAHQRAVPYTAAVWRYVPMLLRCALPTQPTAAPLAPHIAAAYQPDARTGSYTTRQYTHCRPSRLSIRHLKRPASTSRRQSVARHNSTSADIQYSTHHARLHPRTSGGDTSQHTRQLASLITCPCRSVVYCDLAAARSQCVHSLAAVSGGPVDRLPDSLADQ